MRIEDILVRVNPNLRAAAKAQIAKNEDLHVPFFIRALLFAAALTAAGVFAFVADTYLPHAVPLWMRGLAATLAGGVIGAYGTHVSGVRGVLVRQLGVVSGAAGQVLLVIGLDQWRGVAFWQTSTAVAAVSYPFFRNPFHRFAYCAAAFTALFVWAKYDVFCPDVFLALLAVGAFISACGVFLKRWSGFYPLAYALLWGCALEAGGYFGAHTWRPAQILLALFCCGYTAYVLRKRGPARAGGLALGVLAGSLLLDWPTVMGLFLLHLGFRLYDRVLEWTGAAAVVLGVALFYYSLELSLTLKAVTLLAAGGLLLLARRFYAK